MLECSYRSLFCRYYPVQIDIPHDEVHILEKNLQTLEEDYRRFAIGECDVEEEHVDAKIKQARAAPQKNARLQRIHEAYQTLMKATDATH